MRSHDAPALGHANPGLALPAFAARACKLDVCGRRIAPVTRDYAFAHDACQPLRIARVAIRGDCGMTVEILADPVADGERVVPEQFVQDCDIVIDEGLLVPVELLVSSACTCGLLISIGYPRVEYV